MRAMNRKPGFASRVGRPLLAGALAAAAAAPVAAAAQTDVFLKLDGIMGDSYDAKHKGEIDILSYTQSFSNTARLARGTTSGPGRVTCGAVTVIKNIDKASPQLIRLVTTGAHVPTGVITFRAAGKDQLEYYKITMTDVVVTEVEQTDEPAGTIAEKVSILADRLLFEYRTGYPTSTTTTFGWDCVANQKF
jgi:type VI secretion system secreted protein Hcp